MYSLSSLAAMCFRGSQPHLHAKEWAWLAKNNSRIPCHQPQSAKPLTRAIKHVGQQGQGASLVQASSGVGDTAEGWQPDGWRAEWGVQHSGANGIY